MQKSAEGILVGGTGEAIEALQGRKAERTDRPSRNVSRRRPERYEEVSRPGDAEAYSIRKAASAVLFEG